jgi:cell wall assembly regulator SMI1
MRGLNQNDLEYVIDLMDRGGLTAAQANVELVRMSRVRVVSKLTADVRKALNEAVKRGELSHKKKDGRKPEVYYHPNFEHLANAERDRVERETIQALMGVLSYAE